ncbi:MAG: sodium:solute symporter, partial [Myxococcota bacterium]
ALSYFGTDQSQVQRYLTGRSVTESRLGLLFNGLFKIPMQALILFIGVLVFVFYVFVQPPIFFNQPTLEAVRASDRGPEVAALEQAYEKSYQERRKAALTYVASLDRGQEDLTAKAAMQAADRALTDQKKAVQSVIKEALPEAELKDGDYIFVSFVLRFLPSGLVGLLIAVIMSAAMSSTASELNALGSTTVIDIYRRGFRPEASEQHALSASKVFTALWGLIALGFATFANLLDNLIEAVNILGSIFYGTVLGLFLVAFFLRRVGGSAVLIGAAVAQTSVIALFFTSEVGYLWFNVIGCALVCAVSAAVQPLLSSTEES